MQRIRIKKVTTVKDRLFPSPTILTDELSRLTQMTYTYKSVVINYYVTWQGATNFLDTYTQEITDRVV